MLEKNIRYIDYEKIIDPDTHQRLVYFGKYAGIAVNLNYNNKAAIDSLSGLGALWLKNKVGTCLISISQAYKYHSLD